MRPSAAMLVAVALLSGGCGHARHGSISPAKVASLVLARSALPKGFTLYSQGKITSFDVGTGPRASLDRFGRESGWRADYRRQGTAKTPGPLLVISMADVFHDDGGAKQDLAAYEHQFASTVASFRPTAHMVTVTRLGDGAVGLSQLQTGSPGVRYFTLAWRRANATASVSVSGFEGQLTLANAVGLARAQDAELRRAAE